jgi:hypothetical protein
MDSSLQPRKPISEIEALFSSALQTVSNPPSIPYEFLGRSIRSATILVPRASSRRGLYARRRVSHMRFAGSLVFCQALCLFCSTIAVLVPVFPPLCSRFLFEHCTKRLVGFVRATHAVASHQLASATQVSHPADLLSQVTRGLDLPPGRSSSRIY